MFTFANFLNNTASTLITIFFALYFSVYSFLGGTNQPLPKAEEEFTPVVRFAVCSDVHLGWDRHDEVIKHFKDAIDGAYNYAENSPTYKSLDAILIAGDMTGGGREEEYTWFTSILNEKVKEGTQTLVCLGNHEFMAYRDVDASQGYAMFKKYVSEEVDTHKVINGYHFIGVSYASDGKTFSGKAKWLKDQLDQAVKDDPTKPIFVFQHPAPFGTIYGSLSWGSLTIKSILSFYPQVVDFSGHSHYSTSDPRTINQTSFTSVGAGSVSRLMSNINYIDGQDDTPYESGSCWIVEADANGNVRLQLYDVVSGRLFDNVDYFLKDVANVKSRPYTWGNQKSLDTAPTFPENAEITANTFENGSVEIKFPEAYGYYEAESYDVIVKNIETGDTFSKPIVSSYCRADLEEVSVNFSELAKGEYKIKITPCSPFSKRGDSISATFTVK